MAKNTMTPEAIEQRRQASRKHGARAAIRTPAERSRMLELHEEVSTRDGAIEQLTRNAARALLVAELVEIYIAVQVEQGTDITELPVLNRYTSFLAEARRSLVALLAHLPPERQNVVEAELKRIQEITDEHTKKGDKA